MTRVSAAIVLLPTVLVAAATAGGETAKDLLAASGLQGGVVVHVGCGDGTLTASLADGDRYLVEGLDSSADNVAKARRHFSSMGLCGKVSAWQFDGRELPYADNLVNLLVAEDLGGVSIDEVLRVLVPGGTAYVRKPRAEAEPHWERIAKPWPAEIDEWSHFLHDASNNAVAHDRVVAPPRRLQWIGGPLWSRSHEYDSSLSSMVSSGGRLFYIFDEGPTGIVDKRIPDQWMLVARDAFNGVILWKRKVPDWGWRAWKQAEMEDVDWSRMPSQRLRLPLVAPRRLVAAGDRVYVTLGYQAAATAIDAATGQTLATYPDTERTDEMVYAEGRLVLAIRAPAEDPTAESAKTAAARPGRREQRPGPASIVAVETDSGRRLWQTEPGTVVPLSLSLGGSHVYYHDGDAVVCLDAGSGVKCWQIPCGPAVNAIFNTDVTLVAHEEVVLCATRKQLAGLSAADGRLLWQLPAARGFGIANPPDLFVAHGLLWYGQGDIHAESITGYDPSTGKPVRTVGLAGVITRGHHARCYRSKATDEYLLLPKRAVEFIDLDGEDHSRHNWVRGACRYGLLPCNGLLYSTPHPCFCYAGVKLNGFLALAPGEEKRGGEGEKGRRGNGPAPGKQKPQLELGPASASSLSQLSTLDSQPSSDWPMYRRDPRRSGSTASPVDCPVSPVWRAELGGKLSQPVVVDGRLFVARADAGQVLCLDAGSGERLWDFVAGGRIDSSPTCYKGRLIFGSADGSVYCLRASDGVLAWRFQAAPAGRRLVAFGRIESAWPVHGSVLVMNDVAYFAAGRSSFLDGGISLYGLDPLTGRALYQTRLEGPDPDVDVVDENAYAMEGAKSDLLVSDGELIYLFHNAFDRQLRKQPTPIEGEPGVKNLGVRNFGEHLFSNAGFLDDSWFNRSYWMLGDRWPAFNFAHQSPKAGQLVVFDDRSTYAVKCFLRRNMLSPQFFPATDGYYLVADDNRTRPVLVGGDGSAGPAFLPWLPQNGELQTCWNLGVGFARGEPARWVSVVPVRVRAMVRAGGALFAAGEPDACDPDDPTAALDGRSGAVLMALDPDDGRPLFECPLETPPVFDGMIAAGGRLYLSMTDGTVRCLGPDR